ncbi:MAG: sigma 54-interacting transcriptional regulator, partial [Planctomycetota bacterium]
LFGHVRGSFTGAVSDKTGIVEVCHTGTLFLDEISEMSPQLQVKILRMLEEKEFKPVGSVKTKRVDVRFITATNRHLETEVREGTFRKDLFYRLNVIPIVVPPLRERRDDIAVLSEYFLKKYSKQMEGGERSFSQQAKDALLEHRWPGNIRELENAIQRAVALSEKPEITPGDLFDASVERAGTKTTTRRMKIIKDDGIDLEHELADVEISYLRKALEMSGGNYTRAAKLLGLSLRSFRYKIQKYGL